MQPPVDPRHFIEISANNKVSKIFKVDGEKKKNLLAGYMVPIVLYFPVMRAEGF